MTEVASGQSETMRVVCQRVVSGRLLVDAEHNKWAAVPPPGGLVFLTGFQMGRTDESLSEGGLIDEERLHRTAHCLLRAPLACSDEQGWQEDHSEAISVAGLLSSGTNVSMVMIPQACLAGVIPLGQKSVKYNRQVDKQRAQELWLLWVAAVAAKLSHLLAPPTEEQMLAAAKAEATAKMKALALEAPKHPREMFKEGAWAGKFSAWAEDGMPLTEAESGEAVSKSQLKKLARVHAQQKEKWDRFMSKQSDGGGESKELEGGAAIKAGAKRDRREPMPAWLAADPKQGGAIIIKADGTVSRMPVEDSREDVVVEGERVRLVWGTFGGRQSWEAVSNDPFTHALTF